VSSITDRQKQILIAIIEEFMINADEVGSNYLLENYELGVSSATVRAEMAKLMELGMLVKSHISSGRYPTDQAIRLYITEKGKGKLDPAEAAEVQQGLFKVRFSKEQLIKEVLTTLSQKARAASFMVMDDSSRYYGASALTRYDELQGIEQLQRILDVLEDENLLRKVFSKYDGEEVSVLVGSETGIEDMDECSLIFTRFNFLKGQSGHLGVIGSRRLNYSKILPLITTVRDSVETYLRGWR
jgi:transcriptional regulator of heat shock response